MLAAKTLDVRIEEHTIAVAQAFAEDDRLAAGIEVLRQTLHNAAQHLQTIPSASAADGIGHIFCHGDKGRICVDAVEGLSLFKNIIQVSLA